jgi:hypothetical protein
MGSKQHKAMFPLVKFSAIMPATATCSRSEATHTVLALATLGGAGVFTLAKAT